MPDAIAVLFAEEFRPEASGQITAVGIWPPMITIEEFPWSERVAPMLIWRDMKDEVEIKFELRSRSGAVFAEAQFRTGIEGGAKEGILSYLPLPPRRITLSSPDIIDVAIRIEDGEERIVGSLMIQGD